MCHLKEIPTVSGPTKPPEKALYSVDELAALLGVSRRTVIRRFSGEPGVITVGRLRKFPRAVVGRILARLSGNGTISIRYMRTQRRGL